MSIRLPRPTGIRNGGLLLVLVALAAVMGLVDRPPEPGGGELGSVGRGRDRGRGTGGVWHHHPAAGHSPGGGPGPGGPGPGTVKRGAGHAGGAGP
jgi:hypothetical protein